MPLFPPEPDFAVHDKKALVLVPVVEQDFALIARIAAVIWDYALILQMAVLAKVVAIVPVSAEVEDLATIVSIRLEPLTSLRPSDGVSAATASIEVVSEKHSDLTYGYFAEYGGRSG